MRRIVYEVCPHCEADIHGSFDTSLNHRQTTCPECGATVMLCSICPVKDKAFACDKDQHGICMMSKYKKLDHQPLLTALS